MQRFVHEEIKQLRLGVGVAGRGGVDQRGIDGDPPWRAVGGCDPGWCRRLADCRHSPHRDRPAIVIAAITRFIDELQD
jgi:hypothetical protein